MVLVLGASVASAALATSGSDLGDGSSFGGIYANSAQNFTSSNTSITLNNAINQDGSTPTQGQNQYAIVGFSNKATLTFTGVSAQINIADIYVRSAGSSAQVELNVQGANSTLSLGKISNAGNNQGFQVNFTGNNATLSAVSFSFLSASLGSAINNFNFSGEGLNQITNGFISVRTGSVQRINNNIRFKAASGSSNQSKIAGGLKATNATNNVTFDSVASTNSIDTISAIAGSNNIVAKQGNTTISNSIYATSSGGTGGVNTIALNGTVANIGQEAKKITLSLAKEGTNQAYNYVLLNASTNKVYLSEMTVNGYYDNRNTNLNILSFNQDSGNTLVIDSMGAINGSNIIGKNYLTANSTSGFAELATSGGATNINAANVGNITIGTITSGARGKNIINISGKLTATTIQSTYSENHDNNDGGGNIIYASSLEATTVKTYTHKEAKHSGDNKLNITNNAEIGTLESSGSGQYGAGTNYINIGGTLTLTNLITTNGGTNAIKANDFTAPGSGEFQTVGATNKIAIGTGIIGDKSFTRSLYAIASGGYGSENALVLNGANATLGASGETGAINLTIAKDNGDAAASNLVILNGKTTNQAYIGSMQVTGNFRSADINANILSLNGDGTGTLAINTMSANTGSNIIGKDYLDTDTNGHAIRKTTLKGGVLDADNSIFDTNGALLIKNSMNTANSAALDLTLTSMSAGIKGQNLINITGDLNVQTITVQGSGNTSVGNAGNYIVAGNLSAGHINAMYNNDSNAQGGRNALKITGNADIARLNAEGSGTSAGGTNYLEVGKGLTLGSISASNGGTNIIKAKTFIDQSEGDFATTGGTNQITIGDGNAGVNFAKTLKVQTTGGYGANNALYLHGTDVSFGTDDTHRASLIMNRDGAGYSAETAQNFVMLNGSSSNIVYIDKMSASGNFGSGAASKNFNILSLETNNGNVNINSMFARNATNMIGKNLLNINPQTNGVILDDTLFASGQYNGGITNIMSDTNALNGILSITEGLSTEVNGCNIISYVASSNANKTIIRGNTENKTAISGRADIYLNVKNSGFTSGIQSIADFIGSTHDTTAQQALIDNAIIAGNIVASSDGNINLKIIGKSGANASEAATNIKMGILGNIENNSSKSINIILDDAFFAPSELLVGGDLLVAGGKQSGGINTSSGVTNIVTRFTDVSPTQTGAAYYTINTSGNAQTNIVLDGEYQIGGNVNYTGKSAINIIFASDNDAAGDDFETSTATVIADNKVLGTTYTNGLKLSLRDKTIHVGDSNKSFTETYANLFRTYNDGNMGRFLLSRTSTVDTLTINGLILGTITPLENSTQKTYVVEMSTNSAFVGSVAVEAGSKVSLKMDQGSKLVIDNPVFYVDSLNSVAKSFYKDEVSNDTFSQANTIIDLATNANSLGNIASREDFNLLVIGDGQTEANSGLQGENLLFRVYVNTDANQNKASLANIKANTEQNDTSVSAGGNKNSGYMYSDRIFITDTGTANADKTLAQNIQVVFNAETTNLGDIHYKAGGTSVEKNIAVATVGQTTTDKNPLVKFVAQDVLQGFDQVSTTLIDIKTDKYGKEDASGTYTTWFVNSAKSKGATTERAEVSAAALAANYELYLANFNSLNKRMGELRDNANSQGVWVRVFSGAQTNDFGLGSKTTYTTVQAGYDYAFGMEGANNYLGLAVSYSLSSSKSQKNLLQALDNKTVGIDSVKSNTVEVALYNAYIQDEGWYNDSIFKFSYIMSDINLLRQNSGYSLDNMAFTLSNEFGYRFKLGEANEWYIDPQLEVAFGYFNQGEIKQAYGLATLDTKADDVINLRARFGSSFGYDFKQFTQGKGVDAKLYVGAFYEYDYITGGDVTMTTNLNATTTTASSLASDGRVVVNVGTNMTVKENTRIYFDFETSFAGKIRTDYQANVGVRYSFGENTSYVPANGTKKEVTPLKVSDENAKENSSTETKSTEQTNEVSSNPETNTQEKAQ